MNKNIKSLRENILSALPLSMAKEYERMNKRLNNNKEGYYYKLFKKLYDKAFGKDDKGKPIYRKYINVDNIKVDEEIQSFLKQNGYSISEEEFNAGIIIKNKDNVSNKHSLEELQKKGMVLRIGRILNKKKAPQKLILKWDKISKEISNKKLIVISRHPYDIAGQSTDRAWESCMTLPTDKQGEGCNSRFVDRGIKAGVLVAYLISNTDKNINKPLARVLIKPLVNELNKKAYFTVSKIYGTAGEEFRNTVQKWVNKNLNNKIKGGVYNLNDNIYEDAGDNSVHSIIDKNILLYNTNEELYNDYNIVYDKDSNIVYYDDSKPTIKGKIKLQHTSIHKLKLNNNNYVYDYKTNTLYINKIKYKELSSDSIFLYKDIIIHNKDVKELLYLIKPNIFNVFNESVYIDKHNKIIYIYKKFNNENYKGFDYTNSYTIKYVDKIKATNDNINTLVNNLDVSLKDIDVSNVTDMSMLFNKSKRTDFTGIETWNVSKVKYMNNMFEESKFNGDISKWNVSNVTDMSYMFANSVFNGDISKWNVSNVTDMIYMFSNSIFNKNISNWNVSNVKYTNNMFEGSKFNQDISNWNVSNVNNMRYMFANSNFNQDISKWNVSNVIDMSYMFFQSKFNQDISKWNVSKVEDMSSMFSNSKFNGDISNWDTSNVEDMSYMFYKSKFNGDISKWDTSNIKYIKDMFVKSPLENNPPHLNYKATNDNINTLVNNLDISLKDIDVSNVTDMSYLFKYSSRIDYTGIETWNVSNIEDMSYMFYNSNFNGDLSKWDTSNVRNMEYMFAYSSFNQNISKWNVSSVENMSYMFFQSKFNQDISKWNVSSVENMSGMFYQSKFNGDISNWNVSNVIDMSYMFANSNFNQDISKWNVSNVNDMNSIFYNSKFNGDISKWNVSKVEDMNSMFEESNFNQDVSKWDVSNVIGMSYMFAYSNFNGDLSKWNVSNVENMNSMFRGSKFNGNISKWNVSKVEDMSYMFDNSPLKNNPPKWYNEY